MGVPVPTLCWGLSRMLSGHSSCSCCLLSFTLPGLWSWPWSRFWSPCLFEGDSFFSLWADDYFVIAPPSHFYYSVFITWLHPPTG
jgi:hypothetical protein